MKKQYMKPSMEVEVYELNTNIAQNCGVEVSLGPGAPGHDTCEEYKDAWEISVFSTGRSTGTSFYDDGSAYCDCYYTASGEGLFTS